MPRTSLLNQFFFDLPWAHLVLQSLPKMAVSFEGGFQLAAQALRNWKGRVGEELAEFTLIEALDSVRKGSKSTNFHTQKSISRLCKTLPRR